MNPNRGASLKIHRLSFSLPFRTNERMNVVYLSQPPFLSAPRHFRRRRRTFPSYLSTTVATRRTTPACSLLPSDGRQTRTRFHFRRSESGGPVLSLSLSLSRSVTAGRSPPPPPYSDDDVTLQGGKHCYGAIYLSAKYVDVSFHRRKFLILMSPVQKKASRRRRQHYFNDEHGASDSSAAKCSFRDG